MKGNSGQAIDKSAIHEFGEIRVNVIYSSRRTLGISILHDGSVKVRVPRRTPLRTIERLIRKKASWILKHTNNCRNNLSKKTVRLYADGEIHMFRGKESVLKIERSEKTYCMFHNGTIGIGMPGDTSPDKVKILLHRGYSSAANSIFPEMLNMVLKKHANQNFKPEILAIRKMKSRWGSCTNRGKITLNSELIRLPDQYIEYVITHELCHLRHHNHGSGFYALLSELFPDWKKIRAEMRSYMESGEW